jgi:predicted secreted Zn-dependent protease
MTPPPTDTHHPPTATALLSPSPTATLGTSFASTVRRETQGTVTLVTTTNITRYHINGATAESIDTQMRTLGPVDPLGGYHWFALTQPLFDWRYPCPCAAGGCTTGQVTIFLTLDYTLPLWQEPEGASDILRAQWVAFESALTQHERGHGAQATECAWELGRTFAALPPASTCPALDQAVLAASQDVFATCRDAQRQYETETDHGRTQGVIWPP